MPKIKVLPANIANKIAAGEVVDRPASVVKELVENSIDAGAKRISVVVSRSGKELIQVIDDGAGMDERDAELAFERHATSKISDVRDLDHIGTLGFRGEALPSIASVSRLELRTCTPESDASILLKLEGGKIVRAEHAPPAPGTTITVKNLFYNTPARRNFLRADSTEFNHILKVLKRFFLAYPEIHYTVIHNGEELFDLPHTTADERIIQVFGKKFYDNLVYVTENFNEIELHGYVCRPDATRGNSENQFIYLNRRTIINRNLSHAVFQGYGNLIERNRYPQFILFLQIPPHLVDVNVHPTKMEVRFANERVIYHLFLSSVRKAIQKENIVPDFEMKAETPQRKEIQRHFQSVRRQGSGRFPRISVRNSLPDSQQLSLTYSLSEKSDSETPTASNPSGAEAAVPPSPVQANLWQVHNRYILAQIQSGLVIIDQHVAHERILYEKTLRYLEKGSRAPSQQLLFPQTLELALEDYVIYEEISEWLVKIGFSITVLSGRTIVIEAIPADVKVGYEGKILLEILDYFRETEDKNYTPLQKIAAAYACKNAIKSGEKLSLEAMNALIDQLFATQEPFFCPHGRPVIVNLSLEELDKKFKRI